MRSPLPLAGRATAGAIDQWPNELPIHALRDLTVEQAAKMLERDGILLFRCESEADFRATMLAWGRVCPHPHSDPTGFTVVTPDQDRSERGGFNTQALFPHTDRSILKRPPGVLGFWVEGLR